MRERRIEPFEEHLFLSQEGYNSPQSTLPRYAMHRYPNSVRVYLHGLFISIVVTMLARIDHSGSITRTQSTRSSRVWSTNNVHRSFLFAGKQEKEGETAKRQLCADSS